ncbi:hypothetical protein EV401DRAFT_1886591 [Pisolithus croceorrhizus]|nr:hypothetical protein EV401DRAFT_1886591 [Pisolithus croceorrhizus]
MLRLRDPQGGDFPQPVSVSPFELGPRELENAGVLWRTSSEFCNKPDQSAFHSESAGIFHRGALSPKMPVWRWNKTTAIPFDIRGAGIRPHVQKMHANCKRCGVFNTSEFLEGVDLVQERSGVGLPSNSAHASGSDDGPDTQTNTSSYNHNVFLDALSDGAPMNLRFPSNTRIYHHPSGNSQNVPPRAVNIETHWLGEAHGASAQLVDHFIHIPSVAFSIGLGGVQGSLKLRRNQIHNFVWWHSNDF